MYQPWTLKRLAQHQIIILGLGREGWSTYQYLRTALPQTPFLLIDDRPISKLDPKWSKHTASNTLEFAGAVRPLYILSNSGLKEIKGSRFSVGGAINSTTYSFESQSISVSPNDAFYLFTDGIVDQFGGEKGKKFMSQRFKELLMEVKHRSRNDQKAAIEQRLNDWKGEYEQVDDILIIGVKVLG